MVRRPRSAHRNRRSALQLMHEGLRRLNEERIASEAHNRATKRSSKASGMIRSLLDLASFSLQTPPNARDDRGSLVGASVFVGSAQANPIDDCNQSADLERQIDGCTQFSNSAHLRPACCTRLWPPRWGLRA
jgi:hypothetical protein